MKLSKDFKACLLLVAVVLATGLPFVHRAYFVDDYYHMTMARGLLHHPLRPYDFLSDDAGKAVPGWERGHWPRMVNPPLFHFCMAAVMKAWGSEIWKLRTASLLFSMITLLCVYFLGKRVVQAPLWAALLLAATPAYWLTSYSLLIDCGLIAFFMAAFLCFVLAFERQRIEWVVAAGALMGAAILVKYFGVLIIPVCFLWQWMDEDRRKWIPGYWGYAACFAVQLAWGIWNIATYGQMHFIATLPRGAHSTSFLGIVLLLLVTGGLISNKESAGWKAAIAMGIVGVMGLFRATSLPSWIESFYIDKLIVVSTFFGGTAVLCWAAIGIVAKRSLRTVGGVIVATAVLALLLHSKVGGFSTGQCALFALFVGGTAAFLLCAKQLAYEMRSKTDVFLYLWVLLGLLELILVMPWTAARYYLLVLPPACWLFQRMVEAWELRGFFVSTLLGSVIMSILLAHADLKQADTIKVLAANLARNGDILRSISSQPPHHWYYLADTFDGSQPYLEPLGWENVFPNQVFQQDDLFLRSHYRKSSWWTVPDPERFHAVTSFTIGSWNPIRVMDVPASAGFYASCWGALPYMFTDHPLERFDLARVVLKN